MHIPAATKNYCKRTAKSASSWLTAEGLAPSPCGLVELGKKQSMKQQREKTIEKKQLMQQQNITTGEQVQNQTFKTNNVAEGQAPPSFGLVSLQMEKSVDSKQKIDWKKRMCRVDRPQCIKFSCAGSWNCCKKVRK